MIQTTNVDTSLKEAEFYENDFNFSYSSLNTLITAPRAFYTEYILGQKQDEFKKYLLEGTLIHYLVLEHQGFDDKFLVASDSVPSANTVKILERLYEEHFLQREDESLTLDHFENEVDDLLTQEKLHQSTKDKTKRLAKIIDPKGREYFEFMKKRANRTIIDAGMLDTCTTRANIVKTDPQMQNLLGMNRKVDGRTFAVYNELAVSIPKEETGLPFGFKGILDNVTIDVGKRLIRINDFKTTSKSLVNFEESVEFWNYWLQAAMYHTLVKKFFEKFINDEWTIEFRFLVFDKYDQLYPFFVKKETMAEWLESFEQIKKEAQYHYETKDFSLPYEFAKGEITL